MHICIYIHSYIYNFDSYLSNQSSLFFFPLAGQLVQNQSSGQSPMSVEHKENQGISTVTCKNVPVSALTPKIPVHESYRTQPF